MAVLFSSLLAILATANSSHRALQIVSRSILCLLRAVPDLIIALLFVAVVGFGALPGMFALAFHSTGILGKSFVETF